MRQISEVFVVQSPPARTGHFFICAPCLCCNLSPMFSWADIRLLYMRELRSALRERNIVVNSILLPLFLYPLLLWLVYTGISFVGGQTEGFTSRIALKDLPPEHAKFRSELESDDRIALRTSADPAGDLRDGDLDLLVEFVPPAAGSPPVPGNRQVRLSYDNSN